MQTRFAAVPRDRFSQALAGLFRRKPVAIDAPETQRLNFFAPDEAWARGLLTDPQTRASLLRLTDTSAAGAGRFEARQVLLQPGAWVLRLQHTRPGAITADAARAWLADLESLARSAEDLAPPQRTAVASKLELATRSNRSALTSSAVWISLGLIGGLTAVVICLGLAITLASH